MNPDRYLDRIRQGTQPANRTGGARPRNEVPAVDIDGRTATIRLYDPVDSWGEWWGISAKEFAAAIDEIPSKVEEIRLHINSPGGDVFDGIAIVNLLRTHDARIVAIVDGIAASAASFIACSADETIMAPNSELMIHDAWGYCAGNAADMLAMAEMLAHVSDNIASLYAAKAGGTVEDWRAAMQTESWYSAQEAVDAGLADSIATKAADASGDGTDPANRFDLSIFTYAGRDAAPAPVLPAAERTPRGVATEIVDRPSAGGTPPEPAPEGGISPLKAAAFRNLVATTRT